MRNISFVLVICLVFFNACAKYGENELTNRPYGLNVELDKKSDDEKSTDSNKNDQDQLKLFKNDEKPADLNKEKARSITTIIVATVGVLLVAGVARVVNCVKKDRNNEDKTESYTEGESDDKGDIDTHKLNVGSLILKNESVNEHDSKKGGGPLLGGIPQHGSDSVTYLNLDANEEEEIQSRLEREKIMNEQAQTQPRNFNEEEEEEEIHSGLEHEKIMNEQAQTQPRNFNEEEEEEEKGV